MAPGVEAAVAGFECRVLKFLCLRPLVRFAYFPRSAAEKSYSGRISSAAGLRGRRAAAPLEAFFITPPFVPGCYPGRNDSHLFIHIGMGYHKQPLTVG